MTNGNDVIDDDKSKILEHCDNIEELLFTSNPFTSSKFYVNILKEVNYIRDEIRSKNRRCDSK